MGLTSNQKWFPTRAANLSGMLLIGGGGILGHYATTWLFGSPAL